jgi:hypothetical protein
MKKRFDWWDLWFACFLGFWCGLAFAIFLTFKQRQELVRSQAEIEANIELERQAIVYLTGIESQRLKMVNWNRTHILVPPIMVELDERSK